jgi:polysaccharide biosynthesis/export protein
LRLPVRDFRMGARYAVACAVAATAFAGSGCGIISRDGPATGEIVRSAEVTLPDPGYRVSYALVDLTPMTVDFFALPPIRFTAFSRASAALGASEVRIGAGDTVNVSIFEAAGGGLFLPEASRAGNVAIPPQQVDRSGNITIPYAGSIRAIGRTPAELQREIEEKLKARAIEPQAIVTVTNRLSNDITILGEVNSPTRFAAEPAGTKLLSALARAGGTRNPAFESIITVQRRGRTEQALLTYVVTNPAQNINIAPGDVIYVSRQPRAFLAFGATQSNAVGVIGSNNRRFIFEEENLTIADGIAKAGGLIDERADASAVFLYRMTPREMLARAGVDVSRYHDALVPTIFRVDLMQAEGYFIANNFYLQNKDIIYVSNAPARDLNKFVLVIRDVTSTLTDVADTVTSLRGAFGTRR